MKIMKLFRWMLCGVLLSGQVPLRAQAQALSKQIEGVLAPAGQATKEAEPVDPLGRDTPRGAVLGFLQATQQGNYKLASEFLQLSRTERQTHGEQVARDLQILLNSNFSGRLGQVTDRREGTAQLGMPADRERIGTFVSGSAEADVVLARVTQSDVGKVWLFSSETLAKVPDFLDQVHIQGFEHNLPGILVRNQVLGSPLWMWLGVLAFLPIAGALAWAVTQICVFPWRIWLVLAKRQSWQRAWLKVPASVLLILGTTIHKSAVDLLGIPLLYRFYYGRIVAVLLVIGWTWLAFQIEGWAMLRLRQRALARSHASATSFIVLGQRVLKLVIFVVALLAILASLGWNTNAALAGLGISGIALAFAAQKTLEDLFGGASLLADQVIRVGDLCKFGEITGYVEDVSLRSTRIRTLDRTQLAIPNGTLATMNVENLTMRDKMLFRAVLGLRSETSADQLRLVLAEIRRLLYSHPAVEGDTARIRFIGFGESSLDMELYCYVLTQQIPDFNAVREDILLRIMDIVQKTGTAMASPSRIIQVSRDPGLSKEQQEAAEKQVQAWREGGDLPFPDFSEKAVARMAETIVYPDPSSSLRKEG